MPKFTKIGVAILFSLILGTVHSLKLCPTALERENALIVRFLTVVGGPILCMHGGINVLFRT